MEPTNFENNIRQKLDEREIQPSPQAWSKLEAMLPQQETKKKPSVWWYAVAATLVGVLLTVSFLNNSASTTVDTPMATEEIEKEASPAIPINTQNNTSIAVEEEVVSIETEKVKTETPFQNRKEAAAKIATPRNNNAETSIASQKPEIIETTINEEIIVKNQLNKVVAQVQELQQKKDTVTISEVEILLAAAQKEISTQRILSSSKVDPIALLGDVEYEIDRSFRDKVFLALGDGFDAVKVAILDRNN